MADIKKKEKEQEVMLDSKTILAVVKLLFKTFGLAIVFVLMMATGVGVFFTGLDYPIDLIIGLTLIILGFVGFTIFVCIKMITKHIEKMNGVDKEKEAVVNGD